MYIHESCVELCPNNNPGGRTHIARLNSLDKAHELPRFPRYRTTGLFRLPYSQPLA